MQSKVIFIEKVNCTEAGSRHCPCSLYSLGRATVPRPVTTTVATTLSAYFIQTCVRVLFPPVHVSVGSSVGVCDNNGYNHIYWTCDKAKFSHEESKRNFGNLCNLTNLRFANFASLVILYLLIFWFSFSHITQAKYPLLKSWCATLFCFKCLLLAKH